MGLGEFVTVHSIYRVICHFIIATYDNNIAVGNHLTPSYLVWLV